MRTMRRLLATPEGAIGLALLACLALVALFAPVLSPGDPLRIAGRALTTPFSDPAFPLGTDRLVPQARALIAEVAGVVAEMPNDVIVRGHTDGLPYSAGRSMNNWMLSSSRAEATRKVLRRFASSRQPEVPRSSR